MTNEPTFSNPLPNNDEAEKAILGGIFLTPALAHQVFATLEPNDFYNQRYRVVATAIRELYRTAKAIDPIQVSEALKRSGKSLEDLGGIAGIANLTYGLPAFESLADYITLVKKKSTARRAIRLLTDTTERLLAEADEPDDVLAETARALVAASAQVEESHSLKTVAAEVRETFQEWETGNLDMSSVKTGIPELDQKLRLNGLAYGELTLVAARPSAGKTALLLQMATAAVKAGVPTLFISLEMMRDRLVMRMLPALTAIPNRAINPYTLRNMPEERQSLYNALDDLDLPLYFDRSAQLPKLLANAENMVATRGVRLIVFDYLTLIKSGAAFRDSYDKVGNIGYITNSLKELGLRTSTAVLGAAQLNRATERDQRRPNMADLRDSGEIEQAADVILFPYDPDAKSHSAQPSQVADSIWLDLYCGKQRDGEKDWVIPVKYDKNLQTFSSAKMLGIEAPVRSTRAARAATAPPPKSWTETERDDDPDMPDF